MISIKIITPSGTYLEQDVDYVEVRAPHSVLGILPKHAPLVSTLEIAPLKIRFGGTTLFFAAGSGIINVRKDKVIILLSSIERVDEIDLERALEAKKRAEERIDRSRKGEEKIDIARAESALARATNRIRVYNEHR